MAIDINKLLAETLLELCRKNDLQKITIKDILDKSKVSKQTFYNHFRDKADLVHYIYKTTAVPYWNPIDKNLDFCDHLIRDFKMTDKYRFFLQPGCRMTGQNCLKDYMIDHCIQFDRRWVQTFYGKPLPKNLEYAVLYHSAAGMYMKISYLQSNISCSLYEVAENIIEMRHAGLSHLFWENPEESPYAKAVKKIKNIKKDNLENCHKRKGGVKK